MQYFFHQQFRLRGFSLVDVMMGVTLSGVLVFLMASFVTDVMRYSTYIRQHQQLRKETFHLADVVLPQLIREATSIDYSQSHQQQLSLFMDKQERQSIQLSVDSDDDNSSRLVMFFDDDEMRYLNSKNTFVESFDVRINEDPRSASLDLLQDNRSWQPMVSFVIRTRYKRPDGFEQRKQLSFWEDPRIEYANAITLRNYSFSNLRHSL